MEISDMIRTILKSPEWTQMKVADRLRVSQSTVHRWLKGSEPEGHHRDEIRKLYEQETGTGADTGSLVPVIGRVGADPSGSITYADGDETGDYVPLPPGGASTDVAIEVAGFSMRGFVEDGGLLYYSSPSPPSEAFLGEVVVCALDTGERLVKKLLRGSQPGLYDLESIVGDTRRDVRLAWVAEITAIIPPRQARRIIRRSVA